MRVAVLQFVSALDSATNRTRIGERLEALPGDLDLVVLPEGAMHDFGEPGHDLSAVAEALDGPFVTMLATHARRLGATIVAGMFESTDTLPFNTLVVIGPDGSRRDTYRKVHLYDSFGYRESDRLAPGDVTPVVIDVAGMCVGLMTCYDLRFPELARALVDDGADVLLVPAAWVAGQHKLHHWQTLLAARAIENTVFVVAPAQGGDRYTGHSLALDPMGLVLGEAGADDETIVVEIDRHEIEAVREVNPSLSNRRMPT
ncbi:MAG: carbon-nitrogen hydrolase family protein [Aeromicrobium sp.]